MPCSLHFRHCRRHGAAPPLLQLPYLQNSPSPGRKGFARPQQPACKRRSAPDPGRMPQPAPRAWGFPWLPCAICCKRTAIRIISIPAILSPGSVNMPHRMFPHDALLFDAHSKALNAALLREEDGADLLNPAWQARLHLKYREALPGKEFALGATASCHCPRRMILPAVRCSMRCLTAKPPSYTPRIRFRLTPTYGRCCAAGRTPSPAPF